MSIMSHIIGIVPVKTEALLLFFYIKHEYSLA